MPRDLSRYQEVEIRTATPIQLVLILYDATIANLQKARQHVANRDIAGRTHCINKASSILTELQSNLSFEAGGQIAQSLDRLYRYVKKRIFEANLKQDGGPLTECIRLLIGLREAWAEVVRRESQPIVSAEAGGTAAAGAFPAVPQTAGRSATSISKLNLTA